MSTPKDAETYRFDDFEVDVANRQLWRRGARVDLAGRYFDALVLLVREHGQLVGKDRFFGEVWGDVVVGDAALTQCIKDVRRHLGDAAANPRYIQTVPRYGYRFIGPVTVVRAEPEESEPPAPVVARTSKSGPEPVAPGGEGAGPRARSRPDALRGAAFESLAGAVGGAVAGVLGGLLYGFGLAAADPPLGTASVLLVLVSLCVGVGALGGGGVGAGLAAARLLGLGTGGRIAGAALGGMVVGGAAKLLGVDAFTLLLGRAPAGITGGVEGAVLGAALALGAQGGGGFDAAQRWKPIVGSGVAGAAAGVLIPLAGGHLMGGSLELLARSFAASQLHLAGLGRFFGEVHFGPTTQVVLGGVEGLVFAGCVAWATVLARRTER